ncbi:MAG: type IV toxin-antitoxin system AbiEi family antitoxin domain-containing protein [Clostridia bacterium]
MSNYKRIEKMLENNNGIVTSSMLRESNIDNNYLLQLCKKNTIERVSRGVYMYASKYEDEYYTLQTRCNKGVFSHETALYLYDLSDRVPLTVSMTVPSNYGASNLKNENVKLFYIKDDIYEMGITTIKSNYGNNLKVYDIERTICDIIRSKKRIDVALFTDALKRYVKSKDKDLIKLNKYAKALKIENELSKYLEVLL